MAEVNLLTPELFTSPEYKEFREYLLTEKPSEDSPFTFRQIFDDELDRFERLSQHLYYQSQARQGKEIDPEVLGTLTEEETREGVQLQDKLHDEYEALSGYTQRYATPHYERAADEEIDYAAGEIDVAEAEEELLPFGVSAYTFYNANQSFFTNWLKDNVPVGPDSPWRVKALLNPIRLTPGEAYFIVKDEDPNAEFRYINPEAKGEGLAVRSPDTTNNRWIPFRPQFGREWFTEGLLSTVGEEFTGIVAEAFPLPGVKNLLQRAVGEAVTEAAKEGAAGAAKLGAKKGWKTRGYIAGYAGLAASLGRLAQLSYGRAIGVNEIEFDRALEDTGLAFLFALGGAGVMELGLGLSTKIWQKVTGHGVSESMLKRLRVTVESLRKNLSKEEFTTRQLQEAISEAGTKIGKDLKYTPTVAEMSQDVYLQQMMHDIFSQLGLSDKGRAALEAIMNNNNKAVYGFWEALTRNSPEQLKVTYRDFADYIARRNEVAKENAREAARLAEKEIAEEADIARVTAPEGERVVPGTTEELAEPFLRRVETGPTRVFKQNSSEMLLKRQEEFQRRLAAFESAADDLDLVYPNKTTENVRYIKEPFREFLEAGTESGQLIRDMDEAEAARVIRDMVPMQAAGFSSIMRLLGLETDPATGQILPKWQPSLKELLTMRETLFHVFMDHPNSSVRKLTHQLMEGVELQIEDLMEYGAVQQMKKDPNFAGVESFTPQAIRNWMDETDYDGPIRRAFMELRDYTKMINRDWLQKFVGQDARDLADYVLNSSPRQIRDLFQQIYKSPTAIVKMQNLRQMVVDQIRKSVGDGPLKEQNKRWVRFFAKFEDQLSEIFPGEKFTQFKNWAKFQEEALAKVATNAEELIEIERELGAPLKNFITDFLESGAAKKRGGDFVSLDQIEKIIDEDPWIQDYVSSIFKDWLRSRFEKMPLGQAGAAGEGATMFSTGFDIPGFTAWVSGPGAAGPEGTQTLGTLLSRLLGKKEGQEYASNMRMLDVMLQRGSKMVRTQELPVGSPRQRTIEENIGLFRKLIRAIIGPLNPFGRKLTVVNEETGRRLANNLMDILIDPKKLKKLIAAKDRVMLFREFATFAAAIAGERQITMLGDIRETEASRQKESILKDVEDVEKSLQKNRWPFGWDLWRGEDWEEESLLQKMTGGSSS